MSRSRSKSKPRKNGKKSREIRRNLKKMEKGQPRKKRNGRHLNMPHSRP